MVFRGQVAGKEPSSRQYALRSSPWYIARRWLFFCQLRRESIMAQRRSEKPKKVKMSPKQQEFYNRLKSSDSWKKFWWVWWYSEPMPHIYFFLARFSHNAVLIPQTALKKSTNAGVQTPKSKPITPWSAFNNIARTATGAVLTIHLSIHNYIHPRYLLSLLQGVPFNKMLVPCWVNANGP